MLYWVHDIVARGAGRSDVSNSFTQTKNALIAAYGSSFAYKYNAAADVTSSFSPTAIPSGTYYTSGYVFWKTSEQYRANSSQPLLENLSSSAASPNYIQQYFNPNYPLIEIFGVANKTILVNALSQIIDVNIPYTDQDNFIDVLYHLYIDTPIRGGAKLAGGFGRPSDWSGFVYWVKDHYKNGQTLEQIRNNIYSSQEAVNINNNSYVPNVFTTTPTTGTASINYNSYYWASLTSQGINSGHGSVVRTVYTSKPIITTPAVTTDTGNIITADSVNGGDISEYQYGYTGVSESALGTYNSETGTFDNSTAADWSGGWSGGGWFD
jgi:hypothetical protein